jgi:hypothetical protein
MVMRVRRPLDSVEKLLLSIAVILALALLTLSLHALTGPAGGLSWLH